MSRDIRTARRKGARRPSTVTVPWSRSRRKVRLGLMKKPDAEFRPASTRMPKASSRQTSPNGTSVAPAES